MENNYEGPKAYAGAIKICLKINLLLNYGNSIAIYFKQYAAYNLILNDGSVNKIKIKYGETIFTSVFCVAGDSNSSISSDLTVSGLDSLEIEYEEIDHIGKLGKVISAFGVQYGKLTFSHSDSISVKMNDISVIFEPDSGP